MALADVEFSDVVTFVSGVCLGALGMAMYAVKQISGAFDDGFKLGEMLAGFEISIKELSEERDA